MITDAQSGTTLDEVTAGVYRISTPVPPAVVPGGFSFNRILVAGPQPLLFHTGPRGMAPLTMGAIDKVLPVRQLRWIAFSHFENDECGALNLLLAAAPAATPLCGTVNAMINGDAFDRAPKALADGERLVLGDRTFRWLDTPHLPHAWECGYLFEETTRTLLCGDLFTQPGSDNPAVTDGDVLGSSEAMRSGMDYYAHGRATGPLLAKLAALQPKLLACMHGSCYAGDGGALLRALAGALASSR
ncbi:MAG TPA: MBL fold metallo-hydrolase [Planctomycetota bacterium]|nr:MBL fold metallo-hydrolase [Planctomycetota bacterium]